jgi:pathogenesis-related protein 1
LRWSNGRTAVQSVTAGQVVQDWASERADYDHATHTCRTERGHYTQII